MQCKYGEGQIYQKICCEIVKFDKDKSAS